MFDYMSGIDLIVNSTNKYMLCGGGICGQIYQKAGVDSLELYCKQNYKEYMKLNEVRITPGFLLGVDILHIFCPKRFESLNPINELLESYTNIFIEAKKHNYKNILSISLGTGIHGYSHEEVGESVRKHLEKLTSEYDIDFTLVLPTLEIKEKYM